MNKKELIEQIEKTEKKLSKLKEELDNKENEILVPTDMAYFDDFNNTQLVLEEDYIAYYSKRTEKINIRTLTLTQFQGKLVLCKKEDVKPGDIIYVTDNKLKNTNEFIKYNFRIVEKVNYKGEPDDYLCCKITPENRPSFFVGYYVIGKYIYKLIQVEC